MAVKSEAAGFRRSARRRDEMPAAKSWANKPTARPSKQRPDRVEKAKTLEPTPSTIRKTRSCVRKDAQDQRSFAPTSRLSKKATRESESEIEREIFARNFRTLRQDAGLSQRDIQKITGLAQSHLSEIESALHNISLDTMAKLARLVNKPVHELLKP